MCSSTSRSSSPASSPSTNPSTVSSDRHPGRRDTLVCDSASPRAKIEPMSLAAVLLAHAGPAKERLASVPDLETRVGAVLEQGRKAWPQASVLAEAFARHL